MLKLILETAPCPQSVTERNFEGGELSIGRGDDVDWQLDDPDMYLSRKHCIFSEDSGRVMVTDASSGGLYIDNSAHPLGAGNSIAVEPGMRLRIGDFTLFIKDGGAPEQQAWATSIERESRATFDFGEPEGTPPPAERPAELPEPFGERRRQHLVFSDQTKSPETPRPLDPTDPFGLDLSGGAGTSEQRRPEERQQEVRSRSYLFDDDASERPPLTARSDPAGRDLFADLAEEPEKETAEPHFKAPKLAVEVPSVQGEDPPLRSAARSPEPVQTQGAPDPGAADADQLLAALYRGLNLDEDSAIGRSPQDMEQLGRSMRSMVEGVMQLLRTRARERQKVRIAQTIIASSDVNPLKFLASSDEALEALIRPRGKGYLEPSKALGEAFRDLADHQVRTWSAMQSALRRMIDKFDPEEINREMLQVGLLESVLAGGRNAKLWQLYLERYRDIARAAEEEFLGEVGADFRDAYENQRRD